jgi:hypothetical protein
MSITYRLNDLFNDSLSEYKWTTKKTVDGVRTVMQQSLELRVRLRSHYATNFDDPQHGWRKRYGLVFADNKSLLTFNMDSMPGENISKDDQYIFATRMEAEFPEGEEYIIELYKDHYSALRDMPLDPHDATKYGTLQPYILQLRRPTFSRPDEAIVREEDGAWPHVHRLKNIPEDSWPANPAVPEVTVPDLSSTHERPTAAIFSFIAHVTRVENRHLDNSPAQQGRNSTPAYTIKFIDITAPAAAVLKTINIFSNANTLLLHGVLSLSLKCPGVAVFTGFSRNDKYVSTTSSSRVRQLETADDIEELFQEQISELTKAAIKRFLQDDANVQQGRRSTLDSPSRPTPPPLLKATKSPSKYAMVPAVPSSPPPSSTAIIKRTKESPATVWGEEHTPPAKKKPRGH